MQKQNSNSIKSLALDDRPREKLMEKGASALSKSELLAILIGSGTPQCNAVELMQEVMKSCGDSLKTLGGYSSIDLQKFKGIGPAKAITIVAAMELVKRRLAEENAERTKITSPEDVFKIMLPLMTDLPHEEFWVLILNQSNKVVDKRMISKGGISATVVDVRLIMKLALQHCASGIIMCHNHPSGSLMPSREDDRITQKTKEAAALLDMKLLDHVIVASDNGYYSYADEGRL